MKHKLLIDYVYLRLTPEQKQEVRYELAEDFITSFNVLQLMEKRAAGELNERNHELMEEELNASNTKGRSSRRSVEITMPKLQRTGRGGKVDDSSGNILCECVEHIIPIDVLKGYLLEED